jgi:TatA/E family protein of Tat protein translocase
MGSLSLAEILLIVVVILVVFGPRRLPELSRKAGDLLGKLREGTSYVTQAIDSEYAETMEPIRGLKRELDGLKGDVTRAMSGIGDLDVAPPEEAKTALPDEGTDPVEEQSDSTDQ